MSAYDCTRCGARVFSDDCAKCPSGSDGEQHVPPQRPRASREVGHEAPAPLPDAGRLPTPEAVVAVGAPSETARAFAAHMLGDRDAAILARLDAALQAEANGGGDMGTPLVLALEALRAELRGGAS